MQKRKIIYMLFLGVICLFLIVLKSTSAKFVSGFTTGEDIVDLQLNFNIGISNIEEYEEVVIEPNSYEVFHVEITNSMPDVTYYGVWYKMEKPKELEGGMVIARHIENEVPTAGRINSLETKKVTVIIKNSENERMKVNIGVASSTISTQDIEYLGGKHLISGTLNEADYVYDENTSQYISTSDSNIQFITNSTNFSYKGSSQVFNPDHDGVYKLEAWGAQGGSTIGVDSSFSGNVGGNGGYVSGNIYLKKDEKIYIYVGGQGGVVTAMGDTSSQGFNGGGSGGYQTACEGLCIKQAGGGGGATDFRLDNTGVLDTTSLTSRIMVAGGGGGPSNWYESQAGGAAGGLFGSSGTEYSDNIFPYINAIGGTQIAGGSGAIGEFYYEPSDGTFGTGGNSYTTFGGGGGAGYFGGGGGSFNSGVVGSGAGGSSYISGYQGCVAITSASDITPKTGCSDGTTDVTCSYHYSGKIFKNTVMIAGNDNMPTYDGINTMIGNSGNGYAKISVVVPTLSDEEISIEKGEVLTKSQIECVDNGSGCQIARIEDTSNLEIGKSKILVYVMDSFGFVYRYQKEIDVKKRNLYLSNVTPGSYVKYVGNNGCKGKACEGQNANYVDDSDMGYCHNSDYQFIVNGWRVGYIKEGTVYLISAGGVDCMCTDQNGNSFSSSCNGYLSSNDLYMHLDNMNAIALKYCNPEFAYGGVCDETNTWSVNALDFQNITGKILSSSSCYNKVYDQSCGYNNDLIDNGGFYWYATSFDSSSSSVFRWGPTYRSIDASYSYNVMGVRPVLRLKSSVVVNDGMGTYQDPYQIAIG